MTNTVEQIEQAKRFVRRWHWRKQSFETQVRKLPTTFTVRNFHQIVEANTLIQRYLIFIDNTDLSFFPLLSERQINNISFIIAYIKDIIAILTQKIKEARQNI
jgi:hypothetical protein